MPTYDVDKERCDGVKEEGGARKRVRPRQVVVVGVHEPVSPPALPAEDGYGEEQQHRCGTTNNNGYDVFTRV